MQAYRIQIYRTANEPLQKLHDEIARLQVKAPLALSTPRQTGQAESLKSVLEDQIVEIFSQATVHTPTPILDQAVEYAKAQGDP